MQRIRTLFKPTLAQIFDNQIKLRTENMLSDIKLGAANLTIDANASILSPMSGYCQKKIMARNLNGKFKHFKIFIHLLTLFSIEFCIQILL